ncbi:hypothetical protein ACHAXR_003065 [Thalassiosira sp. AJA248-18]
MGMMLEDAIINDFGKRPFHSLDPVPCRSAGAKRGKVFSFFPSVEANYTTACHECPANEACEEAAHEDDRVTRPASADGDNSCGDAVTPTADDYANLFFCEPSEEEEARANLNNEQSSVNAAQSCDDNDHHAAPAAATSPSSTTITHNKKRRRVSFAPSIATYHLLQTTPPAHAMTPNERSTLWFSRSDLEMLKTSAQSSIQDMRSRIIIGNNSQECSKDRLKFRSMMVALEDETDSSIRGLEHRVFRRKRTRQMLIRDVLECQCHVRGLSKFGHEMDVQERSMLLAKVSRERSVKARGVAFVDAKSDYEEVYGDDNDDVQIMCKRQMHARHVSI